jgi:ribosome-binding protein aMBF1 (putative translation factor)
VQGPPDPGAPTPEAQTALARYKRLASDPALDPAAREKILAEAGDVVKEIEKRVRRERAAASLSDSMASGDYGEDENVLGRIEEMKAALAEGRLDADEALKLDLDLRKDLAKTDALQAKKEDGLAFLDQEIGRVSAGADKPKRDRLIDIRSAYGRGVMTFDQALGEIEATVKPSGGSGSGSGKSPRQIEAQIELDLRDRKAKMSRDELGAFDEEGTSRLMREAAGLPYRTEDETAQLMEQGRRMIASLSEGGSPGVPRGAPAGNGAGEVQAQAIGPATAQPFAALPKVKASQVVEALSQPDVDPREVARLYGVDLESIPEEVQSEILAAMREAQAPKSPLRGLGRGVNLRTPQSPRAKRARGEGP